MPGHHRTSIALTGLLLIMLFAAALPVAAQDSAVLVRTNVTLQLRAAASLRADVLATVPYATTLPAEAISPDRGWVRVTVGGQQGWLYFYYLTVAQGSVSTLPVQAYDVETPPHLEGPGAESATVPVLAAPSVPAALFVAIDGFTVPHLWQNWLPPEVAAESVAAADVIVYVREEIRLRGLCASGNYETYLTHVDYAVSLVERASGRVIARHTFLVEASARPTPYGRFQDAWGWIMAVLAEAA
ncbi:MAG: hypothetical protein JW910_22080 [Anaerolineae bacterium]|nr:hypothetical protein [Anaerolineae bacterium]